MLRKLIKTILSWLFGKKPSLRTYFVMRQELRERKFEVRAATDEEALEISRRLSSEKGSDRVVKVIKEQIILIK